MSLPGQSLGTHACTHTRTHMHTRTHTRTHTHTHAHTHTSASWCRWDWAEKEMQAETAVNCSCGAGIGTRGRREVAEQSIFSCFFRKKTHTYLIRSLGQVRYTWKLVTLQDWNVGGIGRNYHLEFISLKMLTMVKKKGKYSKWHSKFST